MYTIELTKIINQMNLENLTPEIDTDEILIDHPDLNRPALQLAGFFDHFDSERIQIIGNVEYAFMTKMGVEQGIPMFERLMSYQFPALIFCRSLPVHEEITRLGRKFGIPILRSDKATSVLESRLIRFLHEELAPRVTMHGVLVDIYGEGVLITGDSGIGKSEAALELIKRGHRLVSDDVVVIRRVNENMLLGKAPDITKYLIELRGIGIIDVRTLFGFAAVRDEKSIDVIIRLEEWDKDQEYDRMGLEDQYTEILGNKVVTHHIPIRPGRNLSIICEAAAANYRQRANGYNAGRELYNRVSENIQRKLDGIKVGPRV